MGDDVCLMSVCSSAVGHDVCLMFVCSSAVGYDVCLMFVCNSAVGHDVFLMFVCNSATTRSDLSTLCNPRLFTAALSFRSVTTALLLLQL